MPFEPQWRRHLRGRPDADDPGAGSEDRRNQVDLFASYAPARELAESGPAAPATVPPAPAAPAPPPPRRRGRALAVLAVLVALVAGAAGGILFERQRAEAAVSFPPEVQVISRPVPQVPPACQAALDKAKQAMGYSIQVERALAEHAGIMNRMMKGQMSGSVALQAGMPSLTRGARASARLDDAAAQFRGLSRQCGP